jgi:hypothetical protein
MVDRQKINESKHRLRVSESYGGAFVVPGVRFRRDRCRSRCIDVSYRLPTSRRDFGPSLRRSAGQNEHSQAHIRIKDRHLKRNRNDEP